MDVLSDQYTLSIDHFPVYLTVGCFQEEQNITQPVLVSIEACFSRRETLDTLESTIDYGLVIQALNDKFSGKSFHLIETIAQSCSQLVLALDDRIMSVKATVQKSFLPDGINRTGSVAITHFRERSI